MRRATNLSGKSDVRAENVDLSEYLPLSIDISKTAQSEIPRIAKNRQLTTEIEDAVHKIPTSHRFYNIDARNIDFIDPETVHLVLTSPPYWTLKEYRQSDGQLGFIDDYEEFLFELDRVWEKCYKALVPGGRLICVVGDVCLSRRKNSAGHTVVPLHASILEHCKKIGFQNLSPIIWHKIANAKYEVEGAGGFLGKPYEPNAIIKNDIEFILMERKPGGYRKPSNAARILSVIPEDTYRQFFQQIWTGLTGASTKLHPAPYPVELAERLIRMFSFAGDTVLDPFMGTGTTCVAAAKWGRNSIGVELDSVYFDMASKRFYKETQGLFSKTALYQFARKSDD